MPEIPEILCARCGTKFPQERGNNSVTCEVCGQLRPDLDLTLEDDDDEGLADGLGAGAGGPSGVAHTALSDYEAGPHVLTSPVQSLPETEAFRVDRPYVALTESKMAAIDMVQGPSLSGTVGPIALVVPALAAGMAGAMHMLYLAPDFSRGSLYAVGSVALVTIIATLVAGFVASGILFVVRLRKPGLLRFIFVIAALGVGYLSASHLPGQILIREDALPGVRLTR